MIKTSKGARVQSIRSLSPGDSEEIKKVRGYTSSQWVDIWTKDLPGTMQVEFAFHPHLIALTFTSLMDGTKYSLNDKYGVSDLVSVFDPPWNQIYTETIPFPKGTPLFVEPYILNSYDMYPYVRIRDPDSGENAYINLGSLSVEFTTPATGDNVVQSPYWQRIEPKSANDCELLFTLNV